MKLKKYLILLLSSIYNSRRFYFLFANKIGLEFSKSTDSFKNSAGKIA